MRVNHRLNAALCTVLMPIGAASSATLFTDRAAWTNAVASPLATEGFDQDIPTANAIVFANGAISTGAIPSGASPTNDVASGVWEMRIYNTPGGNGYSTITLQLPAPVSAFGIDVFSISSTRGVRIAGAWDGAGLQATTLWNHFGLASNGFFGVIGSAPFDTVVFDASGGSVAGDDFFTADNMSTPDRIFADGFQ